jgi:hypothetical protein
LNTNFSQLHTPPNSSHLDQFKLFQGSRSKSRTMSAGAEFYPCCGQPSLFTFVNRYLLIGSQVA